MEVYNKFWIRLGHETYMEIEYPSTVYSVFCKLSRVQLRYILKRLTSETSSAVAERPPYASCLSVVSFSIQRSFSYY